MTLPNLVIVGAAKAGTTSLARNLEAHPRVFMAPGEPHFFSHNWDRGVATYERNFDAAPASATTVGEKSPSYLYDVDAPRRIADTLDVAGGLCCVVLLREPVARAVSDVAHRQRLGRERRTPSEALADELAAPGTGYGYLARGHYVEQLERYVAALGAGPIHVEFTEDLEHDPDAVFHRVGARLGLVPLEFPLAGRRMNASATIRHPAVYRALLRLRAGEWLPRSVGFWVWRQLQEPVANDRLPAELERRLRAHFDEHNEGLAELVGRPLPSAWRSDPPV